VATNKKVADADVAGARLLSRQEMLERVNLSYPTVWQRMRDGKFPRGRDNGGKVVWVEAEIDNWIAKLPVKKLKGDGEAGQ
jgi:prophage regulatory protein